MMKLKLAANQFNTPLNINFYQTNFDVAAAPYTSNINSPLKFESESLTLVNQKDSVWTFKVPITSGIVKISPTENYSLPLSLIVLPAGFPKVKRYPHMIEVMRYITTNHEFNELKNASDQRAVFEEFWLKCGRNKEKAKNLIQQFYFRVEEANTFFTSYKEGWKTDRGIIYVVYGKPHQIYHNNNSETWLYGDETNPLSLNFTFYKQTNPYSDNDYELQRSPTYQSSWYVAIERWRDGRIYN